MKLQVGENEQLVLPPFKLVAAPQQIAYSHFRLDGGEGEEVLTTVNFPKGIHLEWATSYNKKLAYLLEEQPALQIPYKRGCQAVEIEAVNVMEWSAK